MREGRAEELGIASISDLRDRPDLRFGFNSEFLKRGDGWPGLRSTYRLPQTGVKGLAHELAYRGLATGALDLTDLYTTDAKLARDAIRPLEDDAGFFPEYAAVLILYRADLEERAPAALAAVRRLEGNDWTRTTMIRTQRPGGLREGAGDRSRRGNCWRSGSRPRPATARRSPCPDRPHAG